MARVRSRAKRAFTLVEILIVVVILGILAAIVIPQFTDASQEATMSSVKSMLQTIRSQIELYRVKNNGVLPDLSADWDDLVDGDYLQAAPVNPITGGSAVGDMGDDWHWDAAEGNIQARNPDDIDFDGDGNGDGDPLPW
ncbi:MAG: type II secretion system GspH family protein [Phycisphaerales bacterium]|nr:type II secretion system GspH family protein [Phycisphaerales bacterium]